MRFYAVLRVPLQLSDMANNDLEKYAKALDKWVYMMTHRSSLIVGTLVL